jgi:TolB-like protein
MVEPPSAQAPQSAPIAADHAVPPANVWGRLKHHKVLQWTLAYIGAALAIAHGQELMAGAYGWPHSVGRIVMTVLVLGVPLVLTVAWYHGHKGLKRIAAGEMTIIALLLVIIAGGFTVLVHTSEHGASAEQVQQTVSKAPAPEASRSSIAVLPFANLTGDASKDYLGDGMAEEVINTLAKIPGFKVPARTSTFAYKGRNVDVRQIARDLGVGAILEGSVRSAGERIRIDAQLVSAQDGLQIWADSYDRQFADIFKLQDELGAAIVQALRGTLGGASSATARQLPPTEDLEAYELYLQARSIEGASTEDSLRRALALFDQAIARDPHFARAFAGRSTARVTFLVFGYPLANALDDAERDAREALTLDRGLAEAYAAIGTVNSFRANWIEAETSFREALTRAANDPAIRGLYTSNLLAPTGRLREARLGAMEAYHLAPASPIPVGQLATISSFLGFDADAIKYADLSIALGRSPDTVSNRRIHARAAAHAGRYAEAADWILRTLPIPMRNAGGAEVIQQVYAALADPTKKAAASQALERLLRNSRNTESRSFIDEFAMLDALDAAYALANQQIDELQRSRNSGGTRWVLLWAPEMRSFRRDPRFQKLVTRLNFVDYWKRYGPPDDCDLHGETLACR